MLPLPALYASFDPDVGPIWPQFNRMIAVLLPINIDSFMTIAVINKVTNVTRFHKMRLNIKKSQY